MAWRTKLIINNGGFELHDDAIAEDGIIYDSANYGNTILDLENFQFQYAGRYSGPTPTIRMYNTAGGVTGTFFRCVGSYGITPENLDFGSLVDFNDNRQIIYQPAPSTAAPMPHQYLCLGYDIAEDRSFQVWRNDFAGKVNVFGGPINVRKIRKQKYGTGATAHLGSGATTYTYCVTALTYGGETELES